MRVYNQTDFRVAHTHSMFEPHKPFMTVIVKAAFDLVQDGPCTPVAKSKQPKIGKPENFLDAHGNSLKSDSDGAPFKARADCLFVGSGYAPDGVPAGRFDVGFGLGAMRKHLTVHGDRSWVREADGGVRLTEPAPLVELPIRAEYAHGGPTSQFNRHGIGLGKLGAEEGATLPAANIVMHGASAMSWDHDIEPAGLGVLSPDLLPRRRLAGTFDTRWLYRRRPLPPADFDVAFYNTARRDQQVEGYLVGNEEIYLENLHPTEKIFRSRLPNVAIRCFVHRIMDPDRPDQTEFAEVASVLDTCTVDVPAGRVTLVWRGTLEILSSEHERIKDLLVAAEPVDAPLTREAYHEMMHSLMPKPREDRMKQTEAVKQEIARLNARGIKQMLGTLRESGAPKTLVDEVAKQESVDDALRVLTDYVERLPQVPPKRIGQ